VFAIGCVKLKSPATPLAQDAGNMGRYANHSCRPNAESDVVKGKVILRARKKIKPGEEITHDYGREYFDIFLKPTGCKCAGCVERRRKRRRAAKPR